MADGDDIAYLAGLVRAEDRPRYYATLLAPAALRPDLFALYGFAAEIARVPDQVSDATLGEVRLQWWRDALEASAGRPGQGDGPALRALVHTMARHSLPLAPLVGMIEARRADLYSDPPATLADIEGRLGETQSALFQLAALVCGSAGLETAEAAGHAGIAYGLARRLARFAADRARGRTILPADLLREENLSAAELFGSDPGGGLEKVVAALARFGRYHLNLAHEYLAQVPKQPAAAFLPLAVAEPLLRRVERVAVADRQASSSDLEMLARIAWARLRGPKAGT